MSARVAPGPQVAETNGRALFALQMAGLREGREAMVIDTAAGFEEAIAQAVAISDLVLLIVRPTFLDLAAALQSAEVVRKLRKPGLVVLNQAPPARDGIEPPAVKKALKALALMRLPVIPTVLRSRAIYQTAIETGRSVEETADAAAAREVGDLWAFIERFAFRPQRAAADEAPERPPLAAAG